MDKNRLQELAGIEQLNEDGKEFISSGNNAPIDKLVASLASEILKEGVTLAKEVFKEEGPGSSGAKNEAQYVTYATKNFLTTEYQKAIMKNIIEEYKELLH